ncbi:MAG: hypothetical protein ABW328_06060 [Ilumatobacteraceae bacterium]
MEAIDDADGVETEEFGLSAWLRASGGVVFFLAGLLSWWEVTLENGLQFTFNAFDYPWTGVLPYIIFVTIAILTIVIETGSLPLHPILVHPIPLLAGASLGTLLVLVRFVAHGDVARGSFQRGVGLYLAMAAALAVLAGCIISARAAWVDEEDDEDDEDEDIVAFDAVDDPGAPTPADERWSPDEHPSAPPPG